MNSTFKYVFICCVLLVCTLANAQIQIEDSTTVPGSGLNSSPPYIRLVFGLGKTSMGFGGIAFIECDLGNIFFCLRTSGMFHLGNYGPDEGADEFGIVGGYSVNYQLGLISFGAGISKVFHNTQQPVQSPDGFGNPHVHYNIQKTTIGLPLQMELFFTPIRIIGLGLCIFSTVNNLKSFGGIALCLQIGRLR